MSYIRDTHNSNDSDENFMRFDDRHNATLVSKLDTSHMSEDPVRSSNQGLQFGERKSITRSEYPKSQRQGEEQPIAHSLIPLPSGKNRPATH